MKKILITTGGTGGHIYPAMVTAEELRGRGWEVLFVGSFGEASRKLAEKGFSRRDIEVRGFVSRTPFQMLVAAGLMLKAVGTCLGAIRRYRPDIVLGFGGYSSVAAVIAAILLRIPVMIHEQNASPGAANRVLARLARKIAVSFKDSQALFPENKAVWTGCPLRPMSGELSRTEVLRVLGLREDRKTVLVFGGSQGSRSINRTVMSFFEQAPPDAMIQVIHLAGRGEGAGLLSRYARLSFPFFVRDYLENMADAYAAADVVVGRAGAGTVTELGLLGIPAVLVPYPHAGAHQVANARVLERRKAAVIIQEKDLNPVSLGDKIFWVLRNALPREILRLKLAEDFAPDAVRRLADEVVLLQ